jgi:hypothetical protein
MPVVGRRETNKNKLPEFGKPSGRVLCGNNVDKGEVDIDSLIDVMLANRQNSPDIRVMDKIKSGEIGPNSTYSEPLKDNIDSPQKFLQEKLLRDMKMAKEIEKQQNQLRADMVAKEEEAIKMSNVVTEDNTISGLGENVPINVERNNTQENGAVFPETEETISESSNQNIKPITEIKNSNIPDDIKGLLGKLKNSINKEIDKFNKYGNNNE